jgi:hypothetical protein
MIRVDAAPTDSASADAAVTDARVEDGADAAPPDGAELCAAAADCGECADCDLDRGICLPLADATACADGAGACQVGVCLRRSCAVDDSCDDGDPCNGVERCGPDGCQRGEVPSCDDGDACTRDSCGRFLGGCVNIPLDEDGDGHGPLFPSGCGDDCNDANAQVFPGQTVFQSRPIEGMPADRDFDYDCDGEEESIFDEGVGSCELVGRSCLPTLGFIDAIPACGESAFMLGRCRMTMLPSGILGCVALPDSSLRIQRCL